MYVETYIVPMRIEKYGAKNMRANLFFFFPSFLSF